MLTLEQAKLLHATVKEDASSSQSAVDDAVLQNVLAKPFATVRGLPAYPTLLNKIAVLMQGFVYDKPFSYGNRAVAIRSAQLLLDEHGYTLRTDADDVERLLQGIEIGITTWQRITVWLKRNTTRKPPA